MSDSYNKLCESSGRLLFDLITDIPESLLSKASEPEKRCKLLTKKAALKTAAISATLSAPGGFAGILTVLPDIVSVWKIQAQLVSDIAATYGKFAELGREAMLWCLFRHSASQFLRDAFVRTGTRVVTQQVSLTVLKNALQKIGVQESGKFFGRTCVRAIPLIGALGSGAYAFFDTKGVGKTAETYFRALSDREERSNSPKINDLQ